MTFLINLSQSFFCLLIVSVAKAISSGHSSNVPFWNCGEKLLTADFGLFPLFSSSTSLLIFHVLSYAFIIAYNEWCSPKHTHSCTTSDCDPVFTCKAFIWAFGTFRSIVSSLVTFLFLNRDLNKSCAYWKSSSLTLLSSSSSFDLSDTFSESSLEYLPNAESMLSNASLYFLNTNFKSSSFFPDVFFVHFLPKESIKTFMLSSDVLTESCITNNKLHAVKILLLLSTLEFKIIFAPVF